MSVVKRLEPGDFKEYVRVTLEVYPSMFPSMSDQQIEVWIKRMQKQQKEDSDLEYFGYFREDKLLGAMRLHTFKMNVHGVDMLAGGVGNMCVDLTSKKEHIAKELMEYYHRHFWEMGAPLVLLWPFRHDFYMKMGYGYGCKYNKYKVKPGDLPKGSKDGVSFMRQEDKTELLGCFNRYASAKHGMIYKKEGFFDRFLNRYKVVGYKQGERVEGFLGFNFKKLDPDNPLRQNMVIEYMIYENREALRKLLSFLHTQLDQVERIEFLTYDGDLHFLPKDPTDGSDHIFFINQQSNVQGLGIMYRILNKERFIEDLSSTRLNPETVRVRFMVNDSFLPVNQGNMTVHFKEGKPEIGEGYDVTISLNIEYLSSLLMGVVDFKKIWTYGLLEISDSSYVKLLDGLFQLPRPETIEEF
jgi:predicted acetyltransferase